jgi:uncharacterized iron-regulated membrane protein
MILPLAVISLFGLGLYLWRKNRRSKLLATTTAVVPVATPTTTVVPAPAKKRSWSWIWLVVIVLVVVGANWGYRYYKNIQPTASKTPPVAPAQTQQWQLCWEKIPEHRGKTAMRRNCNTAYVERRDEILVVKYVFSGGQGTIVAPKTLDGAYLGAWRDRTGSGNIFFRFVSPSSALGWQDDGKGTEKDPTSLSQK